MLQLDTYTIDYTYQLQKEEYIQEKNVIHNILNNNSFPVQPRKIPKPKQNQTINSQIEIPTQKWATFTILAREPRTSLKYLNTHKYKDSISY